jgi:SAM-dependent methyltransferase
MALPPIRRALVMSAGSVRYPARPVNYQRLYEYRFRDVDQSARDAVWSEIGPFVHRWLGEPARVLDPAAGRCEFLNAVPATERWGVDLVDFEEGVADPAVRLVVGDVMEVDLPEAYFDAVWISNFLEHLSDQQHVAAFLERMYARVKPGGRIAIMGPNFRYTVKEYFDCADHNVLLTHVGVEEHIYTAGFDVERITPQFLPYSFRGRLPASAALTRRYLHTPALWKLLGKQFLAVGRRPLTS